MNVLTYDFETTTHESGNFHSNKNKAVCLGWKQDEEETSCWFSLYSEHINKDCLTKFDLVVAFNAKFELGWSRRLGFELPKAVWCVQLAEYMLDRQKPYPSLEETAKKYELPSKLDIVKTEYWEKGLDTTDVPQDILSEYCIQDVELTYAIYLIQLKQFQERPALYRLFKLACQDLLTLHEMEWNGLPFNETLCKERAAECEKERQEILSVLSSVYPDVPINFGSTDQLSAFLYGGSVVQTVKQPVGLYKTGERKGQVKFQNVDIEHKLPRLVEPLKNSELKKPGYYATDEGTLKKLKGPFAKKYVSLILRLAKLDKLVGTYYEGLPKLNKTMDWNTNMLYPNYNQVVTQTGRLSSSRPNGQNLSNEIADVITSVYVSEFKPISERDIYELFTLVLAYPWYLIEQQNPAYKAIKQNIVNRFEQLKRKSNMNSKQRKEWDGVIDNITKSMNETPIIDINLLVLANAYILKLERELQNIKAGKRIAAVLKPKVVQE